MTKRVIARDGRAKIPYVPGTRPVADIAMLSGLPLPNGCRCTWSHHDNGQKKLKYVNAACPVHAKIDTFQTRETYYPPASIPPPATEEGRKRGRPRKNVGASSITLSFTEPTL